MAHPRFPAIHMHMHGFNCLCPYEPSCYLGSLCVSYLFIHPGQIRTFYILAITTTTHSQKLHLSSSILLHHHTMFHPHSVFFTSIQYVHVSSLSIVKWRESDCCGIWWQLFAVRRRGGRMWRRLFLVRQSVAGSRTTRRWNPWWRCAWRFAVLFATN